MWRLGQVNLQLYNGGMKTLLILVLVVALGVGAFWSRPSRADFDAYIRSQPGHSSNVSIAGMITSLETDDYLKSAIYHDRLLWVTVEVNGQRQYVGAFNHWFKSTPPAAAAPQS
jgi:hypothetical protein